MESFASNIAQIVFEKLASRAYEEIHIALSVKVELNKLEETLSSITLLLLDAEEKQMNNRVLTEWLGKLKDVCYDIDDELDDFAFKQLRMQVLIRGSVAGKVCHLFSRWNSLVFPIYTGHKIKQIRARLNEIAAAKDQFHLKERAGEWHGLHMNRETYSFVQVLDVIGRDNDKENIIIHLLKDTDHADQNVSVISIAGLGGLGKTTLAKLVYNDSAVVRNFDLRMWVCVSYDFDNKSLVRKIIGSATNQKCEEDSFENLAIKLQNELKDIKFLLVLDDVWDKEPMGISITKWIELKALLNIGARGSKIIVTTRNMSVVSLLGSVDYQHPLEGLSHEDCMSLFVERAFRKEEEKNFPHLMEVANNIVKKCGGVPLAVTTLGGMLYLKRELRDWLHVRDNDIWKLEQREDGILPALKLSYDALPLYLKPCFAFCSLFPKDYEFDSVEIITMWMAQGFLHSSTRNEQDFEEIGLDYMRQLCSRSFFHIEEDDFFCMRFKMHDLIHDLAILVAQVEYSSVNFHQSGSFDRVRHLSIYTKDLSDNEEVPDFILQLGKVRTILIPEEKVGITGLSFIKKCISRFKYLRLLDLRSSTFDELPSSIGNLSHLRYVDLSYNCHIKRVPDCICKLQHLQTLLLSHCEELEKFPKDIGNLISLRYLALTTKKTCLPTGIDRLTSLRILHVVACRNLLSLEGLPRLTHLKMFIIEECPVLRSLPHNMKYSTALETLIISDCEKLDLLSLEECVRGLRSFWILKSKLKNFPLWLKECASTLQNICIANCQNLIALPEWLQSFKLLEKLVIENCPQVPALPEGMHCLTTLRELKISGCPRLMERCNRHGGIDWFKIAHVTKIMIGGVNNNTPVDCSSSSPPIPLPLPPPPPLPLPLLLPLGTTYVPSPSLSSRSSAWDYFFSVPRSFLVDASHHEDNTTHSSTTSADGMVNTDGQLFQRYRYEGFGGIFRDSEGLFRGAFAHNVIVPAIHADILAVIGRAYIWLGTDFVLVLHPSHLI